jgi:hypothetical protein
MRDGITDGVPWVVGDGEFYFKPKRKLKNPEAYAKKLVPEGYAVVSGSVAETKYSFPPDYVGLKNCLSVRIDREEDSTASC